MVSYVVCETSSASSTLLLLGFLRIFAIKPVQRSTDVVTGGTPFGNFGITLVEKRENRRLIRFSFFC